MNYFKDIPSGENPPELINVVVEIPKGARNKYEYNEEKGYFALDRALYSAQVFPFDYGFLPQSKAGDGDPLDIVLLTSNPTFPGCVVEARPLGILMMEDENGEDSKVVVAPKKKLEPRLAHIDTIEDIPEHTKKEIKDFFETYKRLEPNKWVKVKAWDSKDKAQEMIERAIQEYSN